MATKLTAPITDIQGKSSGEAQLSEKIFGGKPLEHLIFDAVLHQRAGMRHGNAKVKGRAEVRGGGKKPYKQKGTGHARQGTTRSPLLPGGGKTFGPIPRSYKYRLPKKVSANALRTALSQKQREGKIHVIKELEMKKPATKTIEKLCRQLKIEKALFVDHQNKNLEKSVRNLAMGKYVDVHSLNVFDILKYDNVVLTSGSLQRVEEALA